MRRERLYGEIKANHPRAWYKVYWTACILHLILPRSSVPLWQYWAPRSSGVGGYEYRGCALGQASRSPNQ
eukprot:3314505-Rhodomonas_salina.2